MSISLMLPNCQLFLGLMQQNIHAPVYNFNVITPENYYDLQTV